MNDSKGLIQCLAASLTIIVHKRILTQQDLDNAIKENGYDGLFDLLNETFKELEI